jgi:hypothetical protein
MSTATAVVCDECGEGNFVYVTRTFGMPYDFTCTVCGAGITWASAEGRGAAGELLVVVKGMLTEAGAAS